jgi:hypothetical protein
MVPQAALAQADTRIRVPRPHNTRLQQRRSMADRVLTTSAEPEVKVRISGSAVESITAFLEVLTSAGFR